MATTELIDLAVEVSQQVMCLTLISQLELRTANEGWRNLYSGVNIEMPVLV